MADGLFRRTAYRLGLVNTQSGVSDVRAELPILGSPYQPLNVVNLATQAPTAVSTDRALGLAAVYRSVSILSTSVCQLDVGVWRNGEELALKTTDLAIKPNLDISRAAFMEQTTTSLATTGNAYWLLRGKTSPQAGTADIEVLNPQWVQIDTNQQGKTVYRYHEKTYQAWQVKHLWLMRLPGYNIGIGPIQAAQNELRGALDLRNYADNWFTGSGVPNGILSTDKVLTGEQASQYKEAFMRNQADRSVAVLGQGMAYQPVYLSPADAQFLESRQWTTTEIARMFGIPATYLMTGVEGNSMTYTNTEQIDTVFVKYTLMKYLHEIETALSDLLPRGQEARFKVDVLLRGDTKTRFDAYKTAIEAGFLTPNEVRAREGMLPIPGGSTLQPKATNPNESSENAQ